MVEFASRDDIWTYRLAFPKAPSRTRSALRRLAERVAVAVEQRHEKDPGLVDEPPSLALKVVSPSLQGAKLVAVFRQTDEFGPPVNANTVDDEVSKLEHAYGLKGLGLRKEALRVRTVILLAAESRLAPLVEGHLAALEAGPASTRVDLRGAFHLVSRWWWQNEPLLLSRLAVAALHSDDEEEAPLAFRPITQLYRGVFDHHRPLEQRAQDADELSVATTRILYEAALRRRLKREILQRLFIEAERLQIIEGRPAFDADPARRRLNEVTRVVLAHDLQTPFEPPMADLLALLASAPKPKRR